MAIAATEDHLKQGRVMLYGIAVILVICGCSDSPSSTLAG